MNRHVLLLVLTLQVPAAQQGHVAESAQFIEGPQTPGTPAPAAAEPALMSNDTVLRMHTAGLSDDLIIQTINSQPGRYETGPEDLITLRQGGLSNPVLSAMAARARRPLPKGLVPPAASATPPPASAPALLEVSPVNEIGVYYKDKNGVWQPMESEHVHIKSGGFVKSHLTNGIIKEDRNGMVSGREAKLLLTRPAEFLIYTPEGIEGSEYDLLRFRLNSRDREFRTLTGGVIHSSGGAQRDEVPFKLTRIAPRTYTFTFGANESGGEYGILPPGTGNVTNGGKIYTFATSE